MSNVESNGDWLISCLSIGGACQESVTFGGSRILARPALYHSQIVTVLYFRPRMPVMPSRFPGVRFLAEQYLDHSYLNMETPNLERTILRDLALIYIALAHGADQDLEDVEVDAVAARLREWEAGALDATVLSSIKQALDEYVNDGEQSEVMAAARRVRLQTSREQRQQIVEDLVTIAMSDDKFLHAESRFIEELARLWDVHFAGATDGSDRTWSILGQDGHDEQWTPIHDLALVYLSVAHRSDNDLSDAEIEAIVQKISEWMPNAGDKDVRRIVQDAMTAYVQGPDKRLLDDSVSAVGRVVPEHQRASILADLQFVADADGVLLDREREMIDALARTWGIR
jgi:uncharacterized tellurite resistance protein B-like protein